MKFHHPTMNTTIDIDGESGICEMSMTGYTTKLHMSKEDGLAMLERLMVNTEWEELIPLDEEMPY